MVRELHLPSCWYNFQKSIFTILGFPNIFFRAEKAHTWIKPALSKNVSDPPLVLHYILGAARFYNPILLVMMGGLGHNTRKQKIAARSCENQGLYFTSQTDHYRMDQKLPMADM